MYTVTIDGNYLSHPQIEGFTLHEPNVQLAINTAGLFTFKIYATHPQFGSIKKLKSIIEVFDDGELVFRGRPLNDTIGIHKNSTIECEGDLAFFNDSVIAPYKFKGSVIELMNHFIDAHNLQVDDSRKFRLGDVTVVDKNDFITRSNGEYTKTMDELFAKTVDLLGGYIMARYDHDAGINYIDYLVDSKVKTSQVVELGKNLLDYNQDVKAGDIATVLIPLGAKLKDAEGNDTDVRLTIKDVNQGSEYIEHTLGIEKYGKIVGFKVFDDVTLADNLLKKGQESLNQLVNLGMSIKIKAIDLNMVDSNVQKLRFFEYVTIRSKPHNIDDQMLIKKQTLNLNAPDQNTIEVGIDVSTFTDNQIERDKTIKIIKSDYVTNEKLQNTTDPLIKQISVILQSFDEIYMSVSNLKENMPRGNIIKNLDGLMGVDKEGSFKYWHHDQDGLQPKFQPKVRPHKKTSPTFYLEENRHSLSGYSHVFYTKGQSTTYMTRIVADKEHSFRFKRFSGNHELKVVLKEYAQDMTTINRTHEFKFIGSDVYEGFTVTPLEHTTHITLSFLTDETFTQRTPLKIGEPMFTRGEPAVYQRLDSEAFEYAKAELKITSDAIEAKVEKDGVVAAINLSPESIKILAKYIALEGIITANGNVKIFEDGSIEVNNGVFKGSIETEKDAQVGHRVGFPISYPKDISDMLDMIRKGKGGILWGYKETPMTLPEASITYQNMSRIPNPNRLSIKSSGEVHITGNGAIDIQDISGDSKKLALFQLKTDFSHLSNSGEMLITGEKNLNLKNSFFKIALSNDEKRMIFSLNKPYGNGVFLDASGNLLPYNGVNLGKNDYRYANLFLQNQPNVSSDKRIKRNVSPIDPLLLDAFELLEEKSFVTKHDDKFSFGYVAQDVERCIYKYVYKVWGHENAMEWVDKFKLLNKSESYKSIMYAEVEVIMNAVRRRKQVVLEKRIEDLEVIIKKEGFR